MQADDASADPEGADQGERHAEPFEQREPAADGLFEILPALADGARLGGAMDRQDVAVGWRRRHFGMHVLGQMVVHEGFEEDAQAAHQPKRNGGADGQQS